MTTYLSDEATRDLMVTSEYLGGANAVITKKEPDAGLTAEMLSKELFNEYGGVMTDRSVALFSGSKYDTFTNEVASLLGDYIKNAGGEILWQQNAPCNVSRLLKKSKRTDIIVALDDECLYQAAAYLNSKKSDRRRLIGIGCSPDCVYYLDRGIIDAMLVPDDFTLGYESLLTAVEEGDMESISPQMKMIHPSEVYEKENEKLLFP
jgi:ribose transport system substrate-binding protein